MSGRRLEHGTPEGYDRGCTRHDRCPALSVHGLTCYTAHARFASSERRYMSGYDRRLSAAAIAQLLGLTPPRSSEPPVAAEPIEISDPADDVEAQIEAYAIAKERRDRAAARRLRRDTGGGAAVDEDHLEATGAPVRTAPGPTSAPVPAVCPECAADKHGNCDGTAWDLAADELTTCSCTHPENTPDHQEQTMPKRKTEPTSTPATKPQPPTPEGFETFPKPKPFDGSGRTKTERAEIRAWAEANGIVMGTTGRIPRAVIDEYDAAMAAASDTAPSDGPAPTSDETATERAQRVHTHIVVDETTTTPVDEAAEVLEQAAGAGTIAVVDALAEREPITFPSTEEWALRLRAIRDRQIDEGYDAAHDDEHGMRHLLSWSLDYARRGDADAAHGLVQAAIDLLDRQETVANAKALSAIGEYVYADASEKLDETRHRIELPDATLTRPDWADVAESHDVEQARSLAARIEAENAILLEQLTTANNALEIALRAWAAADERLTAQQRSTEAARDLRIRANRHLLGTIHKLREQLGAAETTIAELVAEANIDVARITALVDEVDRLNAHRWWQIGRAR